MCYSKIRKGNYVSYNNKNYKVTDIIKEQGTGEDAFYKLENYDREWLHVNCVIPIKFNFLIDNPNVDVRALAIFANEPSLEYVHEVQNAYEKQYGKGWTIIL